MGSMSRRKPDSKSRERARRVGQRIRYLRQRADMTLDEVAEAMGLVFQTIAKYENGEIRVSMDRLEPLAAVFKVTPQDVVGWRQDAA